MTRKATRKPPAQPGLPFPSGEQTCANPKCGVVLPAGRENFCPRCGCCWLCCPWCVCYTCDGKRLPDDD